MCQMCQRMCQFSVWQTSVRVKNKEWKTTPIEIIKLPFAKPIRLADLNVNINLRQRKNDDDGINTHRTRARTNGKLEMMMMKMIRQLKAPQFGWWRKETSSS